MLFAGTSLPVTIEATTADLVQGTISIEGLLSYRDRTLTLEYRVTDMSMQPSAVRTLDLSLADLREVELKKGLFGTKIVVRPQRLALFEQMPGVTGDELTLKVKRRDREAAPPSSPTSVWS